MLFFLCHGFPQSIGRTEFFLQLTNNLLSYGFPPSDLRLVQGIGLAWKNQVEVFLQVTVERVSRLVDVQL